MRIRPFLAVTAVAGSLFGCGSSGGAAATTGGAGTGGGGGSGPPAWLEGASVLVSGQNAVSDACRTDICRHNENTDLTIFDGAIYLVHRTAESQVLGPNSALHVYRSTDGGQHLVQTAVIPAVDNRDIRDPHFYQVGGKLFIKTLTRLAVNSERDSNVDTIAMATVSSDGTTWSTPKPIGPATWSFWRIRESAGIYYSAAYEDGDKQVVLYSSTDGLAWKAGAPIYTLSADTPLETELTFMPTGKLLALVRMDGTNAELIGGSGRLRTKICWADPPYAKFDCPDELDGQRLDGPVSFFHDGRLFVVARRHLEDGTFRKRTALFEITGDFAHGGKLAIKVWGDLPSAGDTSYAGVATLDATHSLVTWYSGDLVQDEGWALAIFAVTDIWRGVLDFSKLQ